MCKESVKALKADERRQVWFVGAAVVYTPPSPPHSAPHTLFLLMNTPLLILPLKYASSLSTVNLNVFQGQKPADRKRYFQLFPTQFLSYQTLWFFWDRKLYCQDDDVTFSSVSSCTDVSPFEQKTAFPFIITTNNITCLYEASSPLPLHVDMAATQPLLCPLSVLSSVTLTFYLCLSPMIRYLPPLSLSFLCFPPFTLPLLFPLSIPLSVLGVTVKHPWWDCEWLRAS